MLTVSVVLCAQLRFKNVVYDHKVCARRQIDILADISKLLIIFLEKVRGQIEYNTFDY